MDSSTLAISSGEIDTVGRNEVGRVTLQTRGPLVMDNHDRVPSLGRFVVVDNGRICGGGIIFGGAYTTRFETKSKNIFWSEGAITAHFNTQAIAFHENPGRVEIRHANGAS